MVNVIKIVTHGKYPDKAAELMQEEGVIAIGWKIDATKNKSREQIKNLLKKMYAKKYWSSIPKYASEIYKFRNEIKKGDLVFAYKKTIL